MASRAGRRGYFSMPRSHGRGGLFTTVGLTGMLVVLALSVLSYSQFLLPAGEALECGQEYTGAYSAWVADGSQAGSEPECIAQVPRVLSGLTKFMPLMLLGILLVISVRQRGNVLALPALVIAQLGIWIAPSLETALVIGLAGAVAACLPLIMRGPLAAAAHVGALVMWLPVAMAIVGVTDSTTADLPDGLTWMIDILVFGALPASLIVLPLMNARSVSWGMLIAVVGFLASVLLVLIFISGTAAAGTLQQSSLTPANVGQTNLHVAQSGQATVYAGYAGTPAGARTYSFLQDGITAEVHWSSVRGYEARFTTAVIGTWTNPTATGCTAVSGQCGHLSLAVPSEGAPGVPDFITVGAGPEVAIDATAWHSHPSPLTLYGAEYDVVATNSALTPVGVPVVLRWRPWDGLGAPSLPIR